ncbi:MAG: cell wall hydrolase, partial [bacterium]|nr:cell wall hydrolase [bacterium]
NATLLNLSTVDKKQAIIKQVMEQQAEIKSTQARANENIQRELSIQEAERKAKQKAAEEEAAKEKVEKEKAAKKQAEQKAANKKKINLSSAERTVLERIVEAEAGDQDEKGRMLVANVVMNRVRSKEFPNSVKGVVYEHSGSCYQFSPVLDGSINRIKVSKTTKSAVEKVIKGADESKGALYFIQRNIAGKKGLSWFDRALTKLFKHGCHTFYK